MALETDLALDRSLGARKKLGSVIAALGAVVLLIGLVLSSQVPPERRMPSAHFDFDRFEREGNDWFEASSRRADAQTKAYSCLMFGAFGLLTGLALVIQSSRGTARVLYLDDELRAEAQARGVRRALHDAGSARPPLDQASQHVPPTGYRAMAPSAEHGDVASRLRKLDDLRTQGLVADDEYAEKRREILGSV